MRGRQLKSHGPPWLLSLLLLVLAHPAGAQIPSAIDVDSLQAALPEAQGEERVDILNLISTHDGEFDPDHGLELARQVLTEARQLGYARGEARALENIGHGLYYHALYEAALDTLNLACAMLASQAETRLHGYCRLKLANVLNRQQRRTQAVDEIAAATQLLRQSGDRKGVGHAYNNLGWLHWRVGDYQQAIDAYAKARTIREELGQRRYLAATLNNMGIIRYQWGRYAQALEHYLESLAIREELADIRGQALVNNNIGKIYQDWGDQERARSFFEAALALSDSCNSPTAIGYSLHNLGTVYEETGELEPALAHYHRSLQAYEQLDDAGGKALILTALARVHSARGEHHQALEILAEAMQTSEGMENREQEAIILMHMGAAQGGLGQYERALELLYDSLQRAADMDTRDLIKDVHLQLSDILSAMGRDTEALQHVRIHGAMKDTLFSRRFGQQLADMQTRYETEALRRGALAQTKQMRTQEQRSLMVTILLGLVVLLTIVLAVGIRQKQRAHDGLQREVEVRAEAEIALRESEEKFRTLSDNLPVGVCRIEISPRFQMIEVNPEIVRMFDFASRQEMLAASTKEIFGTPRERFALFRQIVSGEPIAITELPVVTRNGRRFMGALSASAPIEAVDGTKYVDGIIEDVSEQHEFALALRAARDAAEKANRAKTSFLANMSHEIRTPLNAILGYAQILRSDRSLGESQRHAVQTVERSGNHLLALINDILDISKIEAGFQELTPEDFNLGDFIGDLSMMFELRCRQKSLHWEVEADLADRFVHGDQNKLRQILINLLGNAVKFTEEGSVSFSARAVGTDRFCFVVADTGPGIAIDRQQVIFEPFQQEGTTTSLGGTGLGLAIAREHVGLMGGELLLQSSPGQGSTFSFELSLPAAHEAVPASREQDFTNVIRLEPGQQVRALVVDDVDENREVLEKMLQSVGAMVASSRDGAEGLAMVLQGGWDIVFADIRMPTMRGDEMRRRIVAELGEAAPRVVAVTASALEHQRQQYLDEGFDGFIDKPFRAASIYACMADLLGARFEFDADSTAETASNSPDLSRLKLTRQVHDDLCESVRSHNVTLLRNTLSQMADAGGQQKDLARYLQAMSGGYDIKSLQLWFDSHAEELAAACSCA